MATLPPRTDMARETRLPLASIFLRPARIAGMVVAVVLFAALFCIVNTASLAYRLPGVLAGALRRP